MIYVYMVQKNGLYYKHGKWVPQQEAQVWSEQALPENLAAYHEGTLEVLEATHVESEAWTS